MFSFSKVVIFQALWLAIIVHSQLPVNLPPIFSTDQILPNVVSLDTPIAIIQSGNATPPAQPSATTPAPPVTSKAQPPSEIPPSSQPANGPPGGSPPAAQGSSAEPNGTQPNGLLGALPANTSGSMTLRINDVEVSGVTPDITLVVTNVSNRTRISIRNNQTSSIP